MYKVSTFMIPIYKPKTIKNDCSAIASASHEKRATFKVIERDHLARVHDCSPMAEACRDSRAKTSRARPRTSPLIPTDPVAVLWAGGANVLWALTTWSINVSVNLASRGLKVIFDIVNYFLTNLTSQVDWLNRRKQWAKTGKSYKSTLLKRM